MRPNIKSSSISDCENGFRNKVEHKIKTSSVSSIIDSIETNIGNPSRPVEYQGATYVKSVALSGRGSNQSTNREPGKDREVPLPRSSKGMPTNQMSSFITRGVGAKSEMPEPGVLLSGLPVRSKLWTDQERLLTKSEVEKGVIRHSRMS